MAEPARPSGNGPLIAFLWVFSLSVLTIVAIFPILDPARPDPNIIEVPGSPVGPMADCPTCDGDRSGPSGGVLVAKNYPGIITLEFAALSSPGAACRIVRLWCQDGTLGKALANVIFDYAFIVCYTAAFFLGWRWAAARFEAAAIRFLWIGPRTLRALAWSQVLAGVCDMVENAGMLMMLSGHVVGIWPAFTCAFAVVKAVLLLIGAIVILNGVVLRVA